MFTTLLVGDIDGFTTINGPLSPPGGDDVLAHVAALVHETTLEATATAAAAFRRSVSTIAPNVLGQRIPVTVSLRVCDRCPPGCLPEQLYRSADGRRTQPSGMDATAHPH